MVSAAGTGRRIIDRPIVEAALKARRRKPMLLLDVAMPADMARDIEKVDDAFLYAFDDLERVALEGRSKRQAAAEEAWQIVDEALEAWHRREAEREAIPAVVAMRDYFDSAREQVLSDHPGADAAQATRLLINRLLHRPLTAMRDIAASGDTPGGMSSAGLEELVRRLFGGTSDKERD